MGARVPGHSLVSEGAAYAVEESGRIARVRWNSVGGYGRGLCSCGEFSDLLTSAHQRKKWHREHKSQVSG